MTANGQIHWYEGLFLQPHHLQSMQRHILEKIAGERRYRWAHPYGILRMRLSDADLENHRIRFDELHAIMPSGLEVCVPGNAELPSRRHSRQAAVHSRFGLAYPSGSRPAGTSLKAEMKPTGEPSGCIGSLRWNPRMRIPARIPR